MKRIAAALTALGVVLFAGGSGLVAEATGYNSEGAEVTLTKSTLQPGEAFTVEVADCLVGTDITFKFNGVTKVDPCEVGGALTPAFMLGFIAATPVTGSAAATFNAPTTPGTYTGTADYTNDESEAVTYVFTITVEAAATTTVAGATTTAAPAAGLPATGGGSSSSTTILIAGVLLLAGAGMFGVAHARRRDPVAA